MNKFKWGQVKTAKYLDAQSVDDISIFNRIFNNLTTALIKQGRIEDAKKVMLKYDEVMPTKIYDIRNVMSVATMAQNLYTLGYTEKANNLIKRYATYIEKEINYLADVTKSKNQLIGGQNVQIALVYGLEPMARVATQYKQNKLAADLEKKYQNLYQRFSMYFGPQ
jgi:AraC-like DNA-binding protein